MKKTSWLSILGTLVVILVLSFLCTQFLLPLINEKTYSETNCLNDQVTDTMDFYDIAKLYRDSNATCAVIVNGQSTEVSNSFVSSLGSGVAIASKGYEIEASDNSYVASRGSYIATNYHVIEMFDSDKYKNCSVSIMVEDETTYSCELLWYNKDLDVAVIYCDDLNMDYVRMADRSIYCSEQDKLDYGDIFTIGCPLDTMYINRLTTGNVASNNDLTMVTAANIYPYETNEGMKYHENVNGFGLSTKVIDNVYEDVIDVALGITSGNSGGGCFDENGLLIGLTTLGSDVDETGGNQMNGVVPIYPIIEVLDRLILENELKQSQTILNFEELGLVGIDEIEAGYITYMKTETNYGYYFLDENFYDSSYYSDFSFTGDGYYILSNSNKYSAISSIERGCVITSCQINSGETLTVNTRNDFLYILLQVENGDSLTINYNNDSGRSAQASISF